MSERVKYVRPERNSELRMCLSALGVGALLALYGANIANSELLGHGVELMKWSTAAYAAARGLKKFGEAQNGGNAE